MGRLFCKPCLKASGSTRVCDRVLQDLRMEEVNGTPGVRVKSVDIGKNTSGEGGSLGHY